MIPETNIATPEHGHTVRRNDRIGSIPRPSPTDMARYSINGKERRTATPPAFLPWGREMMIRPGIMMVSQTNPLSHAESSINRAWRSFISGSSSMSITLVTQMKNVIGLWYDYWNIDVNRLIISYDVRIYRSLISPFHNKMMCIVYTFIFLSR